MRDHTHQPTPTTAGRRPDRGQAVVLLLALVAVVAVIAVGVGRLGMQVVHQQRAQTAADAAALAGVMHGRPAADRIAARNGATITAYRVSADGLTVTVAVVVGGEHASARATRAP